MHARIGGGLPAAKETTGTSSVVYNFQTIMFAVYKAANCSTEVSFLVLIAAKAIQWRDVRKRTVYHGTLLHVLIKD